MSIFKRHRYEVPKVTVKVDVQDLMYKQFYDLQTMVSALAAKMDNQEEDTKKFQQAVAVLESKAEPSKVKLYANGEVYKVIKHG